jgi:hypothetical protein
MKKIILLMSTILSLNANVNISQNIKALYNGVELTYNQKEYILDSRNKNIDVIKKEINKNKFKDMREKLVVSFFIDSNNHISKFKYLKRSNDRRIDKYTKKTIEKIANKLVSPIEPTELRYIIDFDFQEKVIYGKSNYNNHSSKPSYDKIKRGTTTFKYSSKEYIRTFETTEDGFINMTQEPLGCAKRISILTEKGQKVAEARGNLFSAINKEATKGKYKILVQTKKDCNINLQYP